MAANGSIPTTGPVTPAAMATDINEELAELYVRSMRRLVSAAGTNVLTASSVPALSSYTDGLHFRLEVPNTNTGAVTLNIDGVGAKSLVHSTGTALASGELASGDIVTLSYSSDTDDFHLHDSVGSKAATVQFFTADGTWNKPSGLKYVKVHCVGAGGDGVSTTSNAGAAGGGGAYAFKLISESSLGSTETVNVGTGASDDTSFGSHAIAKSGQNAGTVSVPGIGGLDTSCTGDIRISGEDGTVAFSTTVSGKGGAAAKGWGAGGTPFVGTGSNNGKNYGGGGGGSVGSTGASSGADGCCFVEEFYI